MSEDPRPGQDFLEVPFLAASLNSKRLIDVASEMKLDADDLKVWVEKNRRYLAFFGYKD